MWERISTFLLIYKAYTKTRKIYNKFYDLHCPFFKKWKTNLEMIQMRRQFFSGKSSEKIAGLQIEQEFQIHLYYF